MDEVLICRSNMHNLGQSQTFFALNFAQSWPLCNGLRVTAKLRLGRQAAQGVISLHFWTAPPSTSFPARLAYAAGEDQTSFSFKTLRTDDDLLNLVIEVL